MQGDHSFCIESRLEHFGAALSRRRARRLSWEDEIGLILRAEFSVSEQAGRCRDEHLSKSTGLPTRVENAFHAVRRENSLHGGGVYSRNTRGNKIQRVLQLRHFKREYALNIEQPPLSHLHRKCKGKSPCRVLSIKCQNVPNYLSKMRLLKYIIKS